MDKNWGSPLKTQHEGAAMIQIVRHAASLTDAVIELILEIQRKEFGLEIQATDQPDLLDVASYYQTGAGDFWVALCQNQVVGTIALKDIGNSQGALRKMYVKASHRGKQHAVAAQLLAQLVQAASGAKLQELYLGTTEQFAAACCFYEKNGFARVALAALPEAFPRIPPETRFYRRPLS